MTELNNPQAGSDNKFIRGKDGWLFLSNDSNRVNDQISGKTRFSNKQLHQWRCLLEMREGFLSRKGIAYYFVIAPAKGCVYSDFLPPGVSLSERRCVTQLQAYLKEQSALVRPIYPLDALKDEANTRLVYPMKDTHWNKLGAFLAYRELAVQISNSHRIRVLSAADIAFTDSVLNHSDLGAKIGSPVDQTISAQIKRRFSKMTAHNKVTNRGQVIIFENTKYEYLPKCVMFRDSFAAPLLEFLAESFSRLVAVWQPNIDYSIVLNEQPDIVISQQAERFIPRLPNDLTGSLNREIIDSKR